MNRLFYRGIILIVASLFWVWLSLKFVENTWPQVITIVLVPFFALLIPGAILIAVATYKTIRSQS